MTHKFLRASNAYHGDSLTWCIQAKRPFLKWENFFRICTDWRVFVTMIFGECLAQLAVYVLQQYEYTIFPKWDLYQIAMIGFANTFGQPYPFYPKLVFSRITYGSYVISAFFLNAILVGKFQLFMTIPLYKHQVISVHEIIENGYSLAGDPFVLEYLNNQNQVYNSV